jgi:hypothetical protein
VGDIRQGIESRINYFEVLLPEHLTLLLRKQINHAIKLHHEALKHPDPYLKDLDALYDQFKEHWTKVYRDSISRVFLLQDIIMFHQFLVRKLLEDYTDEPYTINRWELDQAKCIIEQEDHAGAKNGSTVGTAYPVHVIYPLEEIHGPRDVSERGSDIQIRCLVTLCHNVVDIRCRRISSDVESI